MHKYLVIGVTFVDINTTIADLNNIKTYFSLGGKGFNIAKGLGVFGRDVLFHSYLGKDEFLDEIVKTLSAFNVKISSDSFNDEVRSPFGSIIFDKNNKNLFEKVDTSIFKKLKKIDAFDTQITDVIIFSHLPQTILEQIEYINKDKKLRIYLSIAGKNDVGNIISYLNNINVLFANRDESTELLNQTNSRTVEDLMNKYNIDEFISTRDIEGATIYFKTKEGINSYQENNFSGFDDPVINTVGGGDALVCGYINFREQFDEIESLKQAIKVASFHVRQKESSLDKSILDL